MTQAEAHNLALDIVRAIESYVQVEAREIAREEAYCATEDALAGRNGFSRGSATSSSLFRLEQTIERLLQSVVTGQEEGLPDRQIRTESINV